MAADPAGIKIDTDKKTVTVDAKVAPRKLAKYDQIYPIEVVACWPDPKGKKAHETVVTIDVKPSDVHKALESIGLKPGKPALGENTESVGPEVKVSLEIPDGGGTKKISIHRFLIDPKTKQPFPKDVKFRFTGSAMSKPDPTKDDYGLRSRRIGNVDRDLSGDKRDRLPNVADDEGRKVLEAGSERGADAEGRHAGQDHHRGGQIEMGQDMRVFRSIVAGAYIECCRVRPVPRAAGGSGGRSGCSCGRSAGRSSDNTVPTERDATVAAKDDRVVGWRHVSVSGRRKRQVAGKDSDAAFAGADFRGWPRDAAATKSARAI